MEASTKANVYSFSGHSNRGFQVGSIHGHYNVIVNTPGQRGKLITFEESLYIVSSMLTAHLCSIEESPTKPNPSSNVPFRRDPDIVDRDILAKVDKKCSKPAFRVALVGLGGVG